MKLDRDDLAPSAISESGDAAMRQGLTPQKQQVGANERQGQAA